MALLDTQCGAPSVPGPGTAVGDCGAVGLGTVGLGVVGLGAVGPGVLAAESTTSSSALVSALASLASARAPASFLRGGGPSNAAPPGRLPSGQ
eukprot:CAMPEP_0170323156 /NCGR_PEP_ID=MMETSP0116_2-20130129/62372_1 /TAXON_ID=400756 /ORGANISM="Durinskia baltica, Strain CSIRO CS-38" /LENGTH=92 /DNA_ID=CAMNT_0010576047 /DNA_START=17 /DNA_END=293 /DNA_ORIENTATION=-